MALRCINKPKYSKPIVKTIEPKMVGTNTSVSKDRLTKKYVSENRTFYAQELTNEQKSLSKKLSELNISVKHLFPERKSNLVFFENGGKTLFELLVSNTLTISQKQMLLESYKQLIAKLHNMDVSHGHIHFKNVVIDEFNNMRIIDFKKMTEIKNINWNSAENIYSVYENDYFNIVYHLYRHFSYGKSELVSFLKDVISMYHCSQEVKDKLLSIITKKFYAFF